MNILFEGLHKVTVSYIVFCDRCPSSAPGLYHLMTETQHHDSADRFRVTHERDTGHMVLIKTEIELL